MRATVTYIREDVLGQSCVREGDGLTLGAAVGNADLGLPPGDWRRSGISTPGGIIRSLRSDRRTRASRAAMDLEGRLVRVRVEVVDE